MPQVEITGPGSGSTVAPDFTATGTFTLAAAGDPSPVVRLEDADGTVIANGAVTVTFTAGSAVSGTWAATFPGLVPTEGLILIVELPGTQESDIELNIRVGPARTTINPIPGADTLALAAAVAETRMITGTYTPPKNLGILVLALAYTNKNKRFHSLLASKHATLDNPNPNDWSCSLTFTLPDRTRLVIRAVAVNQNGKVVGIASRRRGRA